MVTGLDNLCMQLGTLQYGTPASRVGEVFGDRFAVFQIVDIGSPFDVYENGVELVGLVSAVALGVGVKRGHASLEAVGCEHHGLHTHLLDP